ncbi:hypothetical protein CKAH01_00750 [Colletotrichum kahawae]|uniref:Uncharacterized protein n=1 Tax=Colletotrichum kahawae TaxID=34407 RepID=A0AAD9YJL5_COLKA|nr:hypothetical protein CKAH01_00750 [Colletotrichum kahawae]
MHEHTPHTLVQDVDNLDVSWAVVATGQTERGRWGRLTALLCSEARPGHEVAKVRRGEEDGGRNGWDVFSRFFFKTWSRPGQAGRPYTAKSTTNKNSKTGESVDGVWHNQPMKHEANSSKSSSAILARPAQTKSQESPRSRFQSETGLRGYDVATKPLAQGQFRPWTGMKSSKRAMIIPMRPTHEARTLFAISSLQGPPRRRRLLLPPLVQRRLQGP